MSYTLVFNRRCRVQLVSCQYGQSSDMLPRMSRLAVDLNHHCKIISTVSQGPEIVYLENLSRNKIRKDYLICRERLNIYNNGSLGRIGISEIGCHPLMLIGRRHCFSILASNGLRQKRAGENKNTAPSFNLRLPQTASLPPLLESWPRMFLDRPMLTVA